MEKKKYQSIVFLGLFIFFYSKKKLSLFLRKKHGKKISRSFTALIFRSIFLHVKNRKSLEKTDERRKTYKIECDFSPIRSCVSNRLDNKSSSKCLDGSIKNTFSIYEVHRVENLFATRKFILLYWISIVNSNAKM